jgi:Tol biopolymer transport system component
VDAASGRLTTLTAGEDVREPIFSHDGKQLYYAHNTTRRFVVRDMRTGVDKELLPGGRHRNRFMLSPDGSQFAMMVLHPESKSLAIALMPARGGEPREIASFPDAAAMDWLPDGKHLLMRRVGKSGAELWKIAVDGGNAERIDTGGAMAEFGNIRVSPDGRSIAFIAGRTTSEIWEMENFLPMLSTRR